MSTADHLPYLSRLWQSQRGDCLHPVNRVVTNKMDKQLSNKQNDWSEQGLVQIQRAKHHLLGSKEKFKRLCVGSRRSYRFTTTSLPSYKMTLPSVPKCSTRDNLPQPTWTSDNQALCRWRDLHLQFQNMAWVLQISWKAKPWYGNCTSCTWPIWPNSGSPDLLQLILQTLLLVHKTASKILS